MAPEADPLIGIAAAPPGPTVGAFFDLDGTNSGKVTHGDSGDLERETGSGANGVVLSLDKRDECGADRATPQKPDPND